MARMIAGFFDDDEAARNAVRDLEEAGISSSEMTLVANNADDRWNSILLPRYGDTATGAAAGAVLEAWSAAEPAYWRGSAC
ncbi:hypothetical protein SAMN05444161_9060 [Rhizobiales bacterium GAS191]|nr:hypothetical protein SAMN05444161_9060 [Rhizobiales bacterium GAS191]